MKNLLLLLALAFSSPLLSQEKTEIPPMSGTPKQKFSLGVLTGLNLNYMPYRPNPAIEGGSFDSPILIELAYFAGVSARHPISKRFAVKMDVQYDVKGYGFERNSTFSPLTQRYQASYLDFTPQVEYNLIKNIYLSLGGYGGVLMGERIKNNKEDWFEINPEFLTIANKTNWGIASGLSVTFGRVSVLIKYQQGLTPAVTLEITDGLNASTAAEQFHHSLQIGLGFKVL